MSAACSSGTEDVSGAARDGNNNSGCFVAFAKRGECLRCGPGPIPCVRVDRNKVDNVVVNRCATSKVALVTGALGEKLVSYYAARRGAYEESERGELYDL